MDTVLGFIIKEQLNKHTGMTQTETCRHVSRDFSFFTLTKINYLRLPPHSKSYI